MGKKKHKKDKAHGGHGAFAVQPQVAGIAAALARQVATPAARQMLAGALVAAAGAIVGEAKPRAPVPPAAPIPPEPSVPPEPSAAYTPQFEKPSINLPPEAARVIGAAASALERWAQGLARAPKPPVD